VAPGATIYYYYSTSPTTAIAAAVNANLVHMISMSFGGAEIDYSALAYQPIFQQANAQGITLFASSGDSGRGYLSGRRLLFPALVRLSHGRLPSPK